MAFCVNCFMPRKGWFLFLLLVSILVTVWLTYSKESSARFIREERMMETIAALKMHMKFLESQYGEKQEKLYQSQVNNGRPVSTPRTERNFTFTPALQALLRNITGSRAGDTLLSSEKPDLIQTPFSMRIMPHLLNNTDSLRPAYLLRSERKFAEYIIGVPHIKRDNEIYLYDCLRYLLKNLSEKDKSSTTIVVMIGETDLEYVVSTAYSIEKRFPHELDTGVIEVLSPDKAYYPNLDALPQTLGDSQKRVRWRSKQNLDAIYLMAYAQSRCLYYLMLEDDVIAADGFMQKIQKFTLSTTMSNPDWFFIQYSTTGGIGKLFRSTDLIYFINFVQLFYYNMPIDWLTESYLADRTCGINRNPKECMNNKNLIRPTYKQNLFNHIGAYSSLKGKYQKVKGYKTSTSVAHFPHKNPPVSKIICDVNHSSNYSIEAAYNGDTFFWGTNPVKEDVIEFWFEKPTTVGRYVIRSGSYNHAKDKIYDAVLEVVPARNKTDTHWDENENDFQKLDTVDEFGFFEGNIEEKYGDLESIRIRFTNNSKYWVIINEIEFEEVNHKKKT